MLKEKYDCPIIKTVSLESKNSIAEDSASVTDLTPEINHNPDDYTNPQP